MAGVSRRRFLQLTAGAAAAAAVGSACGAGSDPTGDDDGDGIANSDETTTTLMSSQKRSRLSDVQHVVILIQGSASFDQVFGTREGVRGFADPDVLTLPSGKPIWNQPHPPSADGWVPPLPHRPGCRRPLHPSAQRRLGHPARLGRRRRHGPVRARVRAADDGLLPPRGPAVLRLAGRRVHRLRLVVLPGARPRQPQPARGHDGHDRPAGEGGRPGHRGARHHLRVGDLPRAPRAGRDRLAGVPRRRFEPEQRPRRLHPVPGGAGGHPALGSGDAGPRLRRVRGRLRRRHAAPGSRGWWRPTP